MTTQPAPGWYDDGTGKQRWWDGARWTEEYIDLRERRIELRTDAGPVTGDAASAGWYDDQRGRQRWWDGQRWTTAVRYSGEEQEFAGLVIDGRWIHWGERSRPVAGVEASYESGDALLRRPAFTRAAVERRMVGSTGAITPRSLNRAIHRALMYVVIASADEVWVAPATHGQDAEGNRFVSWVNASAQHYRYR